MIDHTPPRDLSRRDRTEDWDMRAIRTKADEPPRKTAQSPAHDGSPTGDEVEAMAQAMDDLSREMLRLDMDMRLPAGSADPADAAALLRRLKDEGRS